MSNKRFALTAAGAAAAGGAARGERATVRGLLAAAGQLRVFTRTYSYG